MSAEEWTVEDLEVIDALIDGEWVDPGALRIALAAPAGREYLIDALTLREGVSARIETPAIPDQRVRAASPRKWLTLAAAVTVAVGAALGGYAAGSRQAASSPPAGTEAASANAASAAMPPAPAPSPTHVIRLEPGIDWQEAAGGD